MRKKKNKKIGVNQRVVTVKDVKNAKIDAINQVWTIFFTVMHDNEGYGKKTTEKIMDTRK